MCKAMQENYEEGREEGRAEGRADVALELLREGDYSLEKVARLSKLSLGEVIELKEELEKEQRRKGGTSGHWLS